MFLCSSVRSHIAKTTRPNFTRFSVLVIPLTVAQCCSDGTAVYTVYISGFVDAVVFPYNVSKTTKMFCPVRQVAAPGRSLPSQTAE